MPDKDPINTPAERQPSNASPLQQHPLQQTQQWFEKVVLGLNLCPFAHRPARQQQIHFQVSNSATEEALQQELLQELQRLANTPTEQCETSIIIVPVLLGDFYDYQFFMDEANRLLKREQWQGTFQLASFHPRYCFAGSAPEDDANLTNRAPFPLLHILREASLSEVLEHVDHPDEIPNNNIQRVCSLSQEEKQQLFPYLHNDGE